MKHFFSAANSLWPRFLDGFSWETMFNKLITNCVSPASNQSISKSFQNDVHHHAPGLPAAIKSIFTARILVTLLISRSSKKNGNPYIAAPRDQTIASFCPMANARNIFLALEVIATCVYLQARRGMFLIDDSAIPF